MTPTTTTMTARSALSTTGLTKRYGSRTAVGDLTLDIPLGVVAGFIGPNGAGKTTTMAMLLGLVAPTSGGGRVLGHSIDDPAAYLGRVGALVEGPAFWPSLTGAENLRVVATLAGHDTGRIPGVLAFVGLADRAGDRFRHYSLGMKQRLGIAAALLGDPEVLILDEPTNGLDPAGITEMRHLIGRVARHDRTVLVSSHILSELEQVCDWLVVIADGGLVYQGPTAGFVGVTGTVVIAVPDRPDDTGRLAALLVAEGLDAGRDGERGGVIVAVDGADARAAAAVTGRVALEAGIVLVELATRRPTLESHYLSILEGAAS